MNRIVFFGLLIFCMTGNNDVFGQDSTYAYVMDGDSLSSNVPLNEISPRAFRHFKEDYRYITSEQWRKYAKGFSVTFLTPDSTMYQVLYDSQGRRDVVHIYYTGQGAPSDLHGYVDRMCKDCSILFANELIDGHSIKYNIGLLTKDKLRIIEVGNGETRILQEYYVTSFNIPVP